jgi:MFS family permease
MVTSNPMEYTGLVSSTTTDMRVIGGSIGPVIAGIFMSLFVVTYEVGGQVESYPSPLSFNIIFIIALIVALVQAALVVMFRRRAARIIESQRRGDVAAA